MSTFIGSPAFMIALVFGLLILYILPSLIAAIRQVECLGLIIVINLLPTGVGWLAALVGAFMMPRREPPQAYVPRPMYVPTPGCYPRPVQQPVPYWHPPTGPGDVW